MKNRAIFLLVVLFVGSCAPRQHPLPTTPQESACVDYCGQSKSSCKGDCFWWLFLAWPVTLFCLEDCDKKYAPCKQACFDMEIDLAADKYRQVAAQVHLGDSKAHVLEVLEPTQSAIGANYRKARDTFLEGETVVEIYYYRSGRQPDGLITDDEFTPYVFRDGRLVAVGWAALGGPKSQGHVRP